MSRRGNGGGRATGKAIRTAAADLFYKHGYEATTLREIAAKVEIQVGSLYNHISSKEELLYSIMSKIMQELLEETEAVVDPTDPPEAQLRAAVDKQIEFHAKRSKEVFIGNSELRGLTPTHRQAIVALRDEYQQIFLDIVERGQKVGAFAPEDSEMLVFGILAIGSAVSRWYRPRGRLPLSEISRIYADFAIAGLRGNHMAVAGSGAARRAKAN